MSSQQITLSTSRLTIKPLEIIDAEALYPMLSDSAIYRYIPDNPPSSLDDLKERFRRYCEGPSQGQHEEWLNWLVALKHTDTSVGTLQATISVNSRTARIAYLFGPAFWKQGLATEAVSALIDWLLDKKVLWVTADIDTRNESSIKLVKRLGFRLARVTPQADFFKGSSSDEYSFICERETS